VAQIDPFLIPNESKDSVQWFHCFAVGVVCFYEGSYCTAYPPYANGVCVALTYSGCLGAPEALMPRQSSLG